MLTVHLNSSIHLKTYLDKVVKKMLLILLYVKNSTRIDIKVLPQN